MIVTIKNLSRILSIFDAFVFWPLIPYTGPSMDTNVRKIRRLPFYRNHMPLKFAHIIDSRIHMPPSNLKYIIIDSLVCHPPSAVRCFKLGKSRLKRNSVWSELFKISFRCYYYVAA